MLRSLTTFLCLAGMALGYSPPFLELSTTPDGSVLYFLSTLRQKGTAQDGTRKIFRYSNGGFRAIEQQVPAGGAIAVVAIAGDGQLLVFTVAQPCLNSIDCARPDRYRSVLRSPLGEIRLPGIAAVSQNGRYAVTYGNQDVVLTDLATGKQTLIEKQVRAVQSYQPTNTGEVLRIRSALAVWSNGEFRDLPASVTPWTAVIDPEGTVVVYSGRSTPMGEFQVFSYDLARDRETRLGTQANFVCVDGNLALPCAVARVASISSDGQLVAFLQDVGSVNQLYMSASDGSGKRQITSEPEGLLNAVMSGNGQVAYAVTASARIIRVDIGSLEVREVAPPTPFIEDAFLAGSGTRAGPVPEVWVAAGSAVELRGVALTEGGQLRDLWIGEQPAPKVGTRGFQAPWELEEGFHPLRIPSESPFEQVSQVRILPYLPGFLAMPGNLAQFLLFHGHFSGLITAGNPARPEEVIVAYMTGLGPTKPPVASGSPAPVDVLARVDPGFSCRVDAPALGEIEVLYAGLAPGLTGVYQVNLRLPKIENLPPFVRIACGWPDQRGSGAAIVNF